MPRTTTTSLNGCDNDAKADGVASDNGMYPEDVLSEQGISFRVRYTGCIEVKASMKSLDFNTRTQVARECINRVCAAAGHAEFNNRHLERKLTQFVAEEPYLQNSGIQVLINVSSRALDLIHVKSGTIFLSHSMPRISFASGGDTDALDFLAYIAKNEDEFRACYVLECIEGQSEDLIMAIGEAFMLRYNSLNKKPHQPADNYNTAGKENDKDYYNDLPDKLPPDLLTEADLQQQQQKLLKQHRGGLAQQQTQSQPQKLSQLNFKKPRDRLSSNLIDLNSPPPDQTASKVNLNQFDPIRDDAVATAATTKPQTPVRDVFDMSSFSLSAEVQRSQLMTENWFYVAITRPIAESLLQNDGDFLVRESQGKHGQYVLTGLQGRTPKHLLLIDPDGVVRTKDRIFDSISHLINYHWTNSLPIISEDSELVLRNPVIRSAQTNKANNLCAA